MKTSMKFVFFFFLSTVGTFYFSNKFRFTTSTCPIDIFIRVFLNKRCAAVASHSELRKYMLSRKSAASKKRKTALAMLYSTRDTCLQQTET